jgi:hypothetical protein
LHLLVPHALYIKPNVNLNRGSIGPLMLSGKSPPVSFSRDQAICKVRKMIHRACICHLVVPRLCVWKAMVRKIILADADYASAYCSSHFAESKGTGNPYRPHASTDHSYRPPAPSCRELHQSRIPNLNLLIRWNIQLLIPHRHPHTTIRFILAMTFARF